MSWWFYLIDVGHSVISYLYRIRTFRHIPRWSELPARWVVYRQTCPSRTRWRKFGRCWHIRDCWYPDRKQDKRTFHSHSVRRNYTWYSHTNLKKKRFGRNWFLSIIFCSRTMYWNYTWHDKHTNLDKKCFWKNTFLTFVFCSCTMYWNYTWHKHTNLGKKFFEEINSNNSFSGFAPCTEILLETSAQIWKKKIQINFHPFSILETCWNCTWHEHTNLKKINYHLKRFFFIFLIAKHYGYAVKLLTKSVMLVFIGKLSPSTLRWVPICQGFSHFSGFLHNFVLAKSATSRVNSIQRK